MAVVTYIGNRPCAHYNGVRFPLQTPVEIEDKEMLEFLVSHELYSVYGYKRETEEEVEDEEQDLSSFIEENADGSYRCKVCDSNYMSYQWIARHIKSKHSETKEE